MLTSREEIGGHKEWEREMLKLASGQKDVKPMRYNSVLNKYNQTAYKKLNRIRDQLSGKSSDIIALIPAARWLFDNFQMMYREIKKVRTSGTSYEILPILKTKEFKGYPRIYVIAKKMVALSGGHLNYENITVMMSAYQKEIPLTDKEIWVLPEMIGFCLLESIIEVAEEILHIIHIKSKADRFVRDKLQSDRAQINDIGALLVEMDEDCINNVSFHSHVIYLLKNMSFTDGSIQRYLEYHYKQKGRQINQSELFREEGKLESNQEAVIRALIVSLREINETDDEKFFEEFSTLEHILSKDPDGVYPRMDSESRGMYRGIIVRLALKFKLKEEKIAEECLQLALKGREDLNCSHHVGSYLIGKGSKALLAKLTGRPDPISIKNRRNVKGLLYFVLFALLMVSSIVLLLLPLRQTVGMENLWKYVILVLAATPLLMGITLELSNFIFTREIRVKKIPAMEYLGEIPDSARTFIVMPVIISSAKQGEEYLERLEKHYLANRQKNLYFALLADLSDAPSEVMTEDAVIIEALKNRINTMNVLYPNENERFSLFLRYRKWNEAEGCYMCWERKRGKLEEFNHLLCGAKQEDTSFFVALCPKELLSTFQYVITLDADSDLIRDNAVRLVGLIDHPLNHPVIDEEKRTVKEGYVIIQPCVRNHIAGQKRTRFTELFGGQSGLDHYSTVISDIYQDIFNQGIYIGKGIYHIKSFHQLLYGVIKENSVLSHDLLESCYARTAFSSTAKIMDTFPGNVLSYMKREHRWIRGDWQLLPWLFNRKNKDNKSICALSKWKIFDNLRRSMVPLSKILLIILNLALFPQVYYLWIPFLLFSDVFNLMVLLFSVIKQKIYRPKLALLYMSLWKELGMMVKRAFMELAFTPYRAYIACDAAIRTIYRLLVSKKNLLLWNTAEAVNASILNEKKGYFLTMWSSMVPAVLILVLCFFVDISFFGFFLYDALAFLWIAAFYLAYQLGLPVDHSEDTKKTEDGELLQETARRTWQFFKDFSTKENHYLCPDNVQVFRAEKVSDKTSPTNIGLQFLSILSARDLGYETLSSTLEWTQRLLSTVLLLPKWKGHLYNWYHIQNLSVLSPEYISTVDSGNFLGDLISLKNGLLEQIKSPIFPDRLISELKISLKLYYQEGTSEVKYELKDQYQSVGELVSVIANIWEDMNEECVQRKDKCLGKDLLRHMDSIAAEVAGFKLKEESFISYPTLEQLATKDNKKAKVMIEQIKSLCSKIDTLISNMDFTFLYNEKRMLFHIGFHVGSQTLDAGCYDLIASESELTSFLAIARGEVPLKHWYRLGRPLTIVEGIPSFVSWSGTMFEYLMPNLVMKEYEGSVFAEASKAAVLQQIIYAGETGIPWGISESQYYRFDLNGNYQYKAFGVPKLRLQPVRRNSLVVTPYATMLALNYTGKECLANLEQLHEMGMFGDYGFYEAVDFSGPDAEEMTPFRIVKSFMAHHQGMILAAINNYLNDGILQNRFHEEPMVKATEVLLEEKRQSHLISLARRGYTIHIGKVHFKEHSYSNRYVSGVAPKIPVTNYLCNNNYALLITSDGDGFSSYKNMMLYRWRADLYAGTGNYIYIKDTTKNKLWSATYHPTKAEPEEYQAIFSPHKAEFKRVDESISTHTEVSLSPIHNLEIRRVTIKNNSKETREFEITSYLEAVGDSYLAEISHPAFNKLFIESEFLEEQSVFLSRRRSKKGKEYPYLMHMTKTQNALTRKVEFENDRAKFLGRNHTPENPVAIVNSITLTNKAGFVTDPVMSLRVSLRVEAGSSATVTFITGVCDSKEEAIRISDEFSKANVIDDNLEKFRLQSEIELKYLEISNPQLNAFQDLIAPLYYPQSQFRGPRQNIMRNFKNQSFLWRFGVSGDDPIMLLVVSSIEEEGIIRDVLKAYEYMRINRVKVDLIILVDAKYGYLQEVDDLINDMTSSLRIYDDSSDKPSFFTLHTYDMIPAEIDLFYTVARVVFSEKAGIYFKNSRENTYDTMDEV